MRFLYLSLFLLCGCKLELCFRYMHPLTTQRHPISKQLLLYNRRRKSTTSNKKKSIDQQPNKIIDDTYNVVERNVDQIFEDYGVRDTGERTEIGRSERQQKQQAFGQNVLSRFSSRVQKLADQNLAIGASLSLLMVILSGLGK